MNSSAVIAAYFTSWSIYGRGYGIGKLPVGKLSHVNYAFANIKGGVPVLGDPWADANMKSGHNGPVWYQRGRPFPKSLNTTIDESSTESITTASQTNSDPSNELNETSESQMNATFLHLTAPSNATELKRTTTSTAHTTVTTSTPTTVLRGNLGELWELKKKHPHLKTLLSIGGWTWSSAFKVVSNSNAARSKFALATRELLQRYHFDGVDIDWEYPSNPKEHADFVLLLKELRKILGVGLLISVAMPCGDVLSLFRVREVGEVVDYINVMAYDFTIAGVSELADHHSNLFSRNSHHAYSADKCIQTFIKQGAPPTKLILGVPFYARSFQISTNVTDNKSSLPLRYEGAGIGSFERGYLNYRDVPKGKVEWDEACQAAYVFTSELVTKTLTSMHLITTLVTSLISQADRSKIQTSSHTPNCTTSILSSQIESTQSHTLEITASIKLISEKIAISGPYSSLSSSSSLSLSISLSSTSTATTTAALKISTTTTFMTSLYTTSEWQTQVIFFDDHRAISAKASYVKRHSLGGMMFWDASGDTDDHQLLQHLNNALRM